MFDYDPDLVDEAGTDYSQQTAVMLSPSLTTISYKNCRLYRESTQMKEISKEYDTTLSTYPEQILRTQTKMKTDTQYDTQTT